MRTTGNNLGSQLAAWMRGRWLPITLIAVVLLALFYWVAPRRVANVSTVDGQFAWQNEVAPPRRKVVWQPAERLDQPAIPAAAQNSLVRPQLADEGNTLYFTLRDEHDKTDIYRARRVDGKWEPAEPATELNTSASEVGPVISADGQQLYLYSNRPGGRGGFDLYVSRKTDDGWSTPQNLGPEVNSAADEYDPAVSRDGGLLFFASNRTARMHQELAADTERKASDRWSTTLRSDQQRLKFNLYLAERAKEHSVWQPARPLHEVNRLDASDGAPYVDNFGAFLYFASDRSQRPGEAPNFDIYRARLQANRLGSPENLGPSINTSENEIEPALSSEGFRIFFSRNEPVETETAPQGAAERYALYSSAANEVDETVGWDRSRLSALWNLLVRNVWWLTLLALLAALLAALWWFFRNVSLRRAQIPGYLLVAILLHLFLGVGSFFVYFGEDIIAHVQKEYRELVVQTRMTSDNLHQSHKPGEESYEKVADLQSVESVQPTAVPRQVTEMPNVPVAAADAVVRVPAQLNREMRIERIASALPEPRSTEAPTKQLSRRELTPPEAVELARVELEQTEMVENSPQRAPEMVELEVARDAPMQNAPQPLARRQLTTPALPSEPVDLQRAEAEQVATTKTVVPQMARSTPATQPAPAESKVDLQQVAAAQSRAQTEVARAAIEVARNNQMAAPAAAPAPRSRPLLARASLKLPADAAVAEKVAGEPKTSLTKPIEPTLARAEAKPAVAAADAPIAAEALAKPSKTSANTAAPSQQVAIARLNSELGEISSAAPASTRAMPLPRIAASREAGERYIAPVETGVPESEAEVTLARRTLSQPAAASDEPLAAEKLAAVVGATTPTKISGADIKVSRREGDVPAEVGMVLKQAVADEAVRASATTATQRPEVTPPAPQVPLQTSLARSRTAVDELSTSKVAAAEIAGEIKTEATSTLPFATQVALVRRVVDVLDSPSELAGETQTLDPSRPQAGLLSRATLSSETAPKPLAQQLTLGPRKALAAPDPTETEAAIAAAAVTVAANATDAMLPTSQTVAIARAALRGIDDDALEPLDRTALHGNLARPASSNAQQITRTEIGPARPDSSRTPAQLARSAVNVNLSGDVVQTAALAAGEQAAEAAPASGLRIEFERPSAEMSEIELVTADELGGIHRPRDPLLIGTLEKEAIDSPLSASPINSRLTRRPARAPGILYAEDNIGLQAMFRLRQGEARRDALEAFGGNDTTLAAVQRGLVWLAQQQYEEGHWSLNQLRNGAPGAGSVESYPAAVGFALLPFLGDDHTHLEGQYKETVRKGIEWLIANQDENGEFKGAPGNTRMYSHGIATIAMCEAYGLTNDPQLKEPAQRALQFIVQAQHEPTGGWRYVPNQPADTSVVGWQVMALKSGQMAGLDVPPATLELVKKWLASVGGQGAQIGTFGYTSPAATTAMTAEGLLCLEYLGVERSDPRIQGGATFLLKNLPAAGSDTSYYWYYGTQVMYHMQGEYWKQWNGAMRDMVVDTQVKDGPLSGTWNPTDTFEQSGGRIYSTSLRLLMLEVYYRHLPLYRMLEQ